MLLIPCSFETLMERRPWSNWLIIATCVGMSLALWMDAFPEEAVDVLVLQDWNPFQMIGCLFLHADIMHLLGNMIFLWVFGNAICANTNNIVYPSLFFLCGLAADAVHLLMDGNPAIGASGAINGIVGVVLAVYPLNKVSVFWLFFFRGGMFSVSAYGIIIFWLLFDLWGVATGGGGVAYWAHLGGLGFGVLLGLFCLHFRIIETTEWDNRTLMEILLGQPKES